MIRKFELIKATKLICLLQICTIIIAYKQSYNVVSEIHRELTSLAS